MKPLKWNTENLWKTDFVQFGTNKTEFEKKLNISKGPYNVIFVELLINC